MKYQFFCYLLALGVVFPQSARAAEPSAAVLAELDTASPVAFVDSHFDAAVGMAPDSLALDISDPDGGEINLPPEVIDQSPVLQRWLESVPNVQTNIRRDPSFTTRIQAGYTFFPSSDGSSGFIVGVDDVFLGQTPVTISADYQQNFEGDRTAYGADLHYYIFPLGSYFNLSPILGYRYAESGNDYQVNGAHVGVRVRFVPTRTGTADITLDQSWILGDSEGLEITQLSLGYAVVKNVRLSTDFEWQSTADEGDSRVGLMVEWSL